MAGEPDKKRTKSRSSSLKGPTVRTGFKKALEALVAVARQGHAPTSEFFNPSNDWLLHRMRFFHTLPQVEQQALLRDAERVHAEGKAANEAGKAAQKAGPDTVAQLDTGGAAFFSQLGVARRPDLTHYFVDGFLKNRDSLALSTEQQTLFAEILPHITATLKEHFASGNGVIQTDRRIADAPERSFHARQLLVGTRYPQLPYMWRQLTFDVPPDQRSNPPAILEVSLPTWLDDLALPESVKERVRQAGLTQLILKAPTLGLSLHLGFDYVGEHKMGPLSIGMFLVKQAGGVAVQAALSAARIRTLDGSLTNTALVTIGPSLHGKSTLTIMIELAGSELAKLLHLDTDPGEGVYPMNDDIVLLQRLARPLEIQHGGKMVTVTHSIDGTEDNFYAVPSGLTREDDPITYEVLRGTRETPYKQETLENVLVDVRTGKPDFSQNPTRNMRMVLSRRRLIARKGAERLIAAMTNGQSKDSVHIPMEHMGRIFWQAVMRQNTVIPPLRRLTIEQYVRVLMYGEAVQMGAAAGAIGRPYVEFFSDPFIIGLEDENANLTYDILKEMERGGMPQHFYVFNTGGVGAETNEQASGPRYRKIPRELTLMLQEALLRRAVKFEYDRVLRSHVAAAIIDRAGNEVLDLRAQWLPQNIYGAEDYLRRINALTRRRYYGRDEQEKAGILRYTKVRNEVFDLEDLPIPRTERELAWLLSFYWHVDQPYATLAELAEHLREGKKPDSATLQKLQRTYQSSVWIGLRLPAPSHDALGALGLEPVDAQHQAFSWLHIPSPKVVDPERGTSRRREGEGEGNRPGRA